MAKILSFGRDKWIDNQIEIIAPILLQFVDRHALAKRTLAEGPPSRQTWTGHFSARLPLVALVQFLHLRRILEGFHLDAAAPDCFQWMWINFRSFPIRQIRLPCFLRGKNHLTLLLSNLVVQGSVEI
jgi:hypothetical protein